MSNETEIQEIELNIKQAQDFIELGNCLERLHNNNDFRRLILRNYFNNEPCRLVHLKSDHSQQDPDSQASILRQMDAIGSLVHYFQSIRFQADSAQKAIEADRETHRELLEGDNK